MMLLIFWGLLFWPIVVVSLPKQAVWSLQEINKKCRKQFKKEIKDSVRTSVIIPCYYGHARYLYDLLKMFEKQTKVPYEIVISLSEAEKVPQNIIDVLRNEPWPFRFNLILSKEQLFAGLNRNRACEQANGDIFVCQDADDIPHPQRIEIIEYFFNNFNIDHFINGCVFPNDVKRFLDLYNDFDQIMLFYPESYEDLRKLGYLHRGSPAITRRVFDALQWPDDRRGQDTKFNRAVYETFKNRAAIGTPLLIYRQELSSEKDTRQK